ncbi:unnamed protein product [Rotaria socialis]
MVQHQDRLQAQQPSQITIASPPSSVILVLLSLLIEVSRTYLDKPVNMRLKSFIVRLKIDFNFIFSVCLNMGPNAFFNLLLSNLCLIALASYVFFSVTLPMECYSYTTLTESYRNYLTFSGCCSTPYDSVSYIPSGWYRISGAAGTQLLTTPVSSIDICGAPYGGYFNGTLPTTAGASVTGTFCFYTGSPCSFSVAPITAINCNGYYVFYLISLSVGLKYRYCSTS